MVLGLGAWEFVLIGLALLALFGPEHLPQAARTLGRWQTRVRRTLTEIEQTIEEETRGFDEEDDAVPPWGMQEPTMRDRPPEAETWTFAQPDPSKAEEGSENEDDPDSETGST